MKLAVNNRLRPTVYGACLVALGWSCGHAQTILDEGLGLSRTILPGLHQPLDVSPGQTFYSELWEATVADRAYRLASTFESRMPGAAGLPFKFSIDSTLLSPTGRGRDGCDYFSPGDDQFRAWHGLLGTVIAKGDTVGLRVCGEEKEWFVDNSVHNGFPTIWSRGLKKGDPQLTETSIERTETARLPLRRLDYLGVREGAVVVRYSEIDPHPDIPQRTDEYRFSIDENGVATGEVIGAQFRVRPGVSQRASITLTTPMGGSTAMAPL